MECLSSVRFLSWEGFCEVAFCSWGGVLFLGLFVLSNGGVLFMGVCSVGVLSYVHTHHMLTTDTYHSNVWILEDDVSYFLKLLLHVGTPDVLDAILGH